jgi:Condensation domain
MVTITSELVRFRGSRAVESPMTLGQINIHKWLGAFFAERDMPAYGMQTWRMRPGPAVTVADVADTVAVLIARHEGLRTLYLGNQRQRVLDSGELPLHVLTVDDAADPAVITGELDDFVNAQPYDPQTQLPVSVAVAASAGRVVAGVVRCSHLAADHQGMVIIGDEIEKMLTDPAARVVGEPRHQPVDQAEAERRPPLRQRADNALTYWSDRLRAMPANPYTGPRQHTAEESGALAMVSFAAPAAISQIEARTSLDRSTIVLAALLSVLSERTGSSAHTFCMLSNNRFLDRRLSNYLGSLAASALVEVDGKAATFDELGERVRSATIRASLNALYDAYKLHGMAELIEHERGISFNAFPAVFNNATGYFRHEPGGPRPGATMPAGTMPARFTWRPMPSTPAAVRFDVWRTDPVLAMDGWTGNTDRVSRDDVRLMLLAVERLVVAAAQGDLDPRQISAICDIAPVKHDGGWLFVDSCWVELAEVQRVVDDALAPACTLDE